MLEPTPNEALAPVIHKLVTRSPPGQLADVLANCRQLASPSVLPPELAARCIVESNEAGLLVVPLGTEDGRRGIVCDFARLGSRAQREVPYIDPRTDMLFTVDQEHQECTGLKPKVQANDIKAEMQKISMEAARPFMKALQLELDRYVAEHFPAGDGLACGSAYSSPSKDGSESVELRVYISSQRARPKGHWAGSWTSQWRVVFTPGQQEPAKLGGIVEFKTFYSEDGNVQFRRKVTKVAKIAETTDTGLFASELIAAIRRVEEDFHANTEDISEMYGTGALKAMRRVLPLSKERFDWRPLRHALVRDMKAASKEGGS